MLWWIIRKLKPLLAPILELWFRFRDRLDLFILACRGQRTVISIHNEDKIAGGKFVIFAAYPTEKLATCHDRFLRALEGRGYNIIIATNHPRASEIFDQQVKAGWSLIHRRPFGRDFGCYKDATLLLYEKLNKGIIDLNRVIYLNDSIITMRNAEEAIIDCLDDSSMNVVGATENYNKGHHLGSFIMAISGRVLNEKRVIKYWRAFKPISTRRYAIGRGELGFSRVIKRSGYSLNSYWTVDKIKTKLMDKNFKFVNDVATSMEPHFQTQIKSSVNVYDTQLREMLGLEAVLGAAQNVPENGKRKTQQPAVTPFMMTALSLTADDIDRHALSMVRYRERFLSLEEEQQRDLIRASAQDELVNAIVRYVFRGSQIHHGAAPLLFLGAGILKKDVVLRKIVEPFNIAKLLKLSGACSGEEAEEVIREVLAKGHPYSLQGKARLLHDWDFT